MNIKRMVRKLADGLDTAYGYVYESALVNACGFLIELFTASVTIYYAITNAMPVIPQWAWFGMFIFMLIVGTSTLEDLVYWDVDEDDDEEEEIVEDG